MLDRGNVIGRFQQANLGAGIQPGHAATEQFHVKLLLFEIKQVEIGDLKFTTRRRTQRSAQIDDLIVVNIKARNGKVRFRLLGFFLQTYGPPVGVELHDTVTLRIAHLISENACSLLNGQRVAVEIEFAVKNVVTEDQGNAGPGDKICADEKSFCDPIWFCLLSVMEIQSELGPVAQKITQHRQILWRGDDQDLAQTAEHESSQRIADHRLVVDRKQLLAYGRSERKQPGARAACEENRFFVHPLTLYVSNLGTGKSKPNELRRSARLCQGPSQNRD